MPSIKAKTHKGIKKRFTVSATGKVRHKRCGSSHINSHMSGSKIRRMRKKATLKLAGFSQKLRRKLRTNETVRPLAADRMPKSAQTAVEGQA